MDIKKIYEELKNYELQKKKDEEEQFQKDIENMRIIKEQKIKIFYQNIRDNVFFRPCIFYGEDKYSQYLLKSYDAYKNIIVDKKYKKLNFIHINKLDIFVDNDVFISINFDKYLDDPNLAKLNPAYNEWNARSNGFKKNIKQLLCSYEIIRLVMEKLFDRYHHADCFKLKEYFEINDGRGNDEIDLKIKKEYIDSNLRVNLFCDKEYNFKLTCDKKIGELKNSYHNYLQLDKNNRYNDLSDDKKYNYYMDFMSQIKWNLSL